MTVRRFSGMHIRLLAIAAGLVGLVRYASVSGQEDAFAIRTVLVSVTDAEGARIEGLAREDFEIRERGISRDVVEVADEGVSGELYLLVDTSIVFQPHIFLLRRSLAAFVDALGSGYQIHLYEFGSRPRRLTDSKADRADLSREIGAMMAHAEGAYLLDALYETARELNDTEREEGTPRVRFVIVTGTGPELSNTSDMRALESGRSSGAVFDVVLYQGAEVGDFMKRAKVDDVLDRLSEESGGSLTRLLSVNALENTLLRLASETLQPAYRVSFLTELSPPPSLGDLQVTVHRTEGKASALRLLPGETRVEPQRP